MLRLSAKIAAPVLRCSAPEQTATAGPAGRRPSTRAAAVTYAAAPAGLARPPCAKTSRGAQNCRRPTDGLVIFLVINGRLSQMPHRRGRRGAQRARRTPPWAWRALGQPAGSRAPSRALSAWSSSGRCHKGRTAEDAEGRRGRGEHTLGTGVRCDDWMERGRCRAPCFGPFEPANAHASRLCVLCVLCVLCGAAFGRLPRLPVVALSQLAGRRRHERAAVTNAARQRTQRGAEGAENTTLGLACVVTTEWEHRAPSRPVSGRSSRLTPTIPVSACFCVLCVLCGEAFGGLPRLPVCAPPRYEVSVARLTGSARE
jgi:hypothetical protein